jgi:hypothetical protein
MKTRIISRPDCLRVGPNSRLGSRQRCWRARHLRRSRRRYCCDRKPSAKGNRRTAWSPTRIRRCHQISKNGHAPSWSRDSSFSIEARREGASKSPLFPSDEVPYNLAMPEGRSRERKAQSQGGPTPMGERRAKRWIVFGTTSTTLGLIASLAEPATASALLTILGLVAAASGLHRYGRLGPNPTTKGRRGA